MDEDIWTQCHGIHYLTSYHGTVWRLVQTQEVIATRKLVDSLEEQAILEELIHSSISPHDDQYADFHPLLTTPFRYPPLTYGSRFGKKTERALWYGSLDIATIMAEKAFYQFNFIHASDVEFGTIEIPITIFSAQIKTDRAIKLTDLPFSKYKKIISSPDSYAASQALGASMRKDKIDAFTFHSARDPQHGTNLALFTPTPFIHKKPDHHSFQSWECIATTHLVEFIRSSSYYADAYSFPVETFYVNEALPLFPADNLL